MPPLRERREDIPLLLHHFLRKISIAEDLPAKTISDEALSHLQGLEWPGNVRQLEHTVQMAVALSGNRELLCLGDFQASGSATAGGNDLRRPLVTVPTSGIDFDKTIQDLERSLLAQALTLSRGNKAKAAQLLRIKRTTLLAKMKVLSEGNTQEPDQPGQLRLQLVPKRSFALVLEPDGAVRRFVAKTLERQNFQVVEASNRVAAIDLIECWGKKLSLVIGASEELSECLPTLPSALATVIIKDFDDTSYPLKDPRARFLRRPFSSDDLIRALDGLISTKVTTQQRICA